MTLEKLYLGMPSVGCKKLWPLLLAVTFVVPTLNSNRIFRSSFAKFFFDTILARGFCLAFLGEANGKRAEHVVVSCLHIHMSLNEGLLSLRVYLEYTLGGSFLLRRL